jgi:OHCU decarboxylase
VDKPPEKLEDKPLSINPKEQTIGDFTATYGAIYEHSPWIAEGAYAQRDNIHTVLELHTAMKASLAAASKDRKLALIKAHPELACAEGVKLTDASVSEQAGAGLKECTPEEFAEFQQLNKDYQAKFGFPFIVAVKGHNRQSILKAFRERIKHDPDDEFEAALEQINKIAYFRLMALA